MSRTATSEDRTEPVTRDDLEAKLRELKGEVDDTAQAATGVVVAVAAVTVVGVVAIAFLIGKRKGRKKTTVVEIRRV
jgi:signal transduction histidine kinase